MLEIVSSTYWKCISHARCQEPKRQNNGIPASLHNVISDQNTVIAPHLPTPLIIIACTLTAWNTCIP